MSGQPVRRQSDRPTGPTEMVAWMSRFKVMMSTSLLASCAVKPSLRPHPLHAGLRSPCGGALIIVFLRLLCWLVTHQSQAMVRMQAMLCMHRLVTGYWILVTGYQRNIWSYILYILMYIDALLLCYNNIIIHKSTFN